MNKEDLIKKIKNGKISAWMFKIYIDFKYFGFRYKCPMCGFWAKKFLPAGFGYQILEEKQVVGARVRNNARCPNCKSSDRERLLFLYLKNETNIFKTKNKLLHIAPERILQKIFKKNKSIEYFSADLNSPLAEYKMDIRDIKFNDNYFDFVICNHVLEHIENDGKAMAEIYRVLKPSGIAILQVPISLNLEKTFEDFNITGETERIKYFGQKDHVRIYGQDYKDRLGKVGFKVEVIDYTKTLGDKKIKKYSLIPEEKIYLVKK